MFSFSNYMPSLFFSYCEFLILFSFRPKGLHAICKGLLFLHPSVIPVKLLEYSFLMAPSRVSLMQTTGLSFHPPTKTVLDTKHLYKQAQEYTSHTAQMLHGPTSQSGLPWSPGFFVLDMEPRTSAWHQATFLASIPRGHGSMLYVCLEFTHSLILIFTKLLPSVQST